MAIVIPTGYAQVTYNWKHSASDRRWSTVLGTDHNGATAGEIEQTFEQAWVEQLSSIQDNSITLESITVRMGPNSGSTPGLSVELPVGLNGDESIQGVSANCTVLVKKLTAVGGKANRGRNYWPGFLAETMVDEVGAIDPVTRDSFQGFFGDFFGALGSGNAGSTEPCPVVILHDAESPSSTPQPVVAILVDSIIGTQRRRIR